MFLKQLKSHVQFKLYLVLILIIFFSGSKMGLVERKHHNVNQETRTGKRFKKYLFSSTCLNYLHRVTLKSKTIKKISEGNHNNALKTAVTKIYFSNFSNLCRDAKICYIPSPEFW